MERKSLEIDDPDAVKGLGKYEENVNKVQMVIPHRHFKVTDSRDRPVLHLKM